MRKFPGQRVRWPYALLMLASMIVVPMVQGTERPVAGEQVLRLPEDGSAWYMTLFLNPGQSFDLSEPRIASLKQQTHFNTYRVGDPMFERYRPIVKTVPCIVIQKPNGVVVEVISKSNAVAMGDDVANCIFWRRRQQPVQPAPVQPSPVQPSVVPNLDGQGPPTEGPSDLFPTLLAVGCFAAGLALGAGHKYYQTYYSEE